MVGEILVYSFFLLKKHFFYKKSIKKSQYFVFAKTSPEYFKHIYLVIKDLQWKKCMKNGHCFFFFGQKCNFLTQKCPNMVMVLALNIYTGVNVFCIFKEPLHGRLVTEDYTFYMSLYRYIRHSWITSDWLTIIAFAIMTVNMFLYLIIWPELDSRVW